MQQIVIYVDGKEIVAIFPLQEEPKEGSFSTYYVGNGVSVAEAIGNAMLGWFNPCTHETVEVDVHPGGEEYKFS